MVIPPPGAVCPAIVTKGLVIFNPLPLRSIVPPTRKTHVRAPLASTHARRLPVPLLVWSRSRILQGSYSRLHRHRRTVSGITRVKSVQVLPGIRIGLDTPEPGSRALCWRFGLDALMRDVASMHLGSHSRLPTVDSSPPSLYALVFFNQTCPATLPLLRGDRGMPVAQRLCRPDRECRSTVG